jgi:hypothetical protein
MGTKITTIAFDADILKALDDYAAKQKPRASRTALVNQAVVKLLIEAKAWPPKRSK